MGALFPRGDASGARGALTWLATALIVAATRVACMPSRDVAGPAPNRPAASAPVVVSVPEPEPEVPPDEPLEQSPRGPSPAGGWDAFHGGPERTGRSRAAAIQAPHIRWQARVGIQSWLNSPIVYDGVVIAPSSGKAHNKPDPADGVHALDAASGRELWHAHFDDDANGVARAGGALYATSDDGHLYCLDAETGAVRWKVRGKGKVYTHPLAVAEIIVVGDEKGWLRGVSREDGGSRFEVQLTGAIRGGAAADGERIYAVSEGGEALALDFAGKAAWRRALVRPPWRGQGRDVPVEVYSTPIVAGDLLIVPFARDTYYDGVPALMALDVRTGEVRWRATGPESWGNIRSTPALAGGTLVYSEPYSGDVVGIDATSGRATFRRTIDTCYFPQWASPAIAGGVAYVPRFGGTLFAVSLESHDVLWEIYLGDSSQAGRGTPRALKQEGCSWEVASGWPLYSPVAIAPDGTLLVGSEEGVLYAIDDAQPRRRL